MKTQGDVANPSLLPRQVHDPNEAAPKRGAAEQWTIRNNNIFGHTFHIHDVQFTILSRTSGVQECECGWTNTLHGPHGETVSFIAKIDDAASATDASMDHCHLSHHEDGGLRGQFSVVKDGA